MHGGILKIMIYVVCVASEDVNTVHETSQGKRNNVIKNIFNCKKLLAVLYNTKKLLFFVSS